MKLSEYIKEFGDKQVDVDKLSEFIIEDKVFVPKEGERYYFISNYGIVTSNLNNCKMDKTIINYNQVYRTRTEAEFARDKAIFLEFMRKEFLRNSDVIDWENPLQDKFYLLYNYMREELDWGFNQTIQVMRLHTTNKEWLEQFIVKYEDDIKKYYFEIKED